MAQRRVIFDLGTVVRARGHSDGITRTVRAFARYAAAHRDDVIFAVFDTETDAFHPINPQCVALVLDGAKVDTSHFPDPYAVKPRLRERLPRPLKRIALIIQRPRRQAFLLAERLRFQAARPTPLLSRAQNLLMTEKYRTELTTEGGERRWLLPYDMVMGPQLSLTPDDVVLMTGSDWPSLQRIAKRVAELNSPRLVILCHDIIPILFPQFFYMRDVRKFRSFFEAMFPAAALTVFTSNRVRDDARTYSRKHKLALGETAIVPLGADFSPRSSESDDFLPPDILPGRYAMFVSTIEPRKNHNLLFKVWKRLLAEGIPQANDFQLVFVGRQGWLMKDALAEMKADPCFNDSLLMMSDVDDRTLDALYANAAFCVYPSFYEGFGLPIIEAFSYGKAVLSSTGGALPEVVGSFSPCMDPTDEDLWTDTFRKWIEDPSARAPYEDAIRNRFKPRSWDESGQDLFETLDRVFVDAKEPAS